VKLALRPEPRKNARKEDLHRDNPGPPSCAKIEGGQLLIDSAGKPIPDFLLCANQAISSGSPSEAKELLSEDNLDRLRMILKEDSSRIDLIYMLVRLLLALGRAAKAESWCQRIIKQDSTDVAWFHMAHICRHIPDSLPKALYWARRAFEAKPDCEPYIPRVGRSLFAPGNPCHATLLWADHTHRSNEGIQPIRSNPVQGDSTTNPA
jgi:hypothetical protein